MDSGQGTVSVNRPANSDETRGSSETWPPNWEWRGAVFILESIKRKKKKILLQQYRLSFIMRWLSKRRSWLLQLTECIHIWVCCKQCERTRVCRIDLRVGRAWRRIYIKKKRNKKKW